MKNKICICILAYKNPNLLQDSLAAVAAQQTPPDSELCIVIIDNDPAQSTKAVYENARFPFSVFYEKAQPEGIPHACNAALQFAVTEQCTHILFVADDMLIPPDYTKNLLAVMQRKNADAVRGKMQTIGDDKKPSKVRRASLFSRQDILPSNGILVGKKIFADWELRFNPLLIFATEDADFFYRAYLRGARLYHAENIWFAEQRPAGKGLPKDNRQKLVMDMWRRRNHVSIRRHLGGFWRGLFFALRQGLPILFLQIPANVLLLPFAPKKRGYKILLRFYKIYGLAWGMWVKEIPGTAESFYRDHPQLKK